MPEPWSPALDDVAKHIPSRTRDKKTPGSDALLGTFTSSTTPDASQAQAVIDAAVLGVLSVTGRLDPADEGLVAQARAAAEWRAAADIEIAYPDRSADVAVYDQLDARAKYELANLVARLQGQGEGPADLVPYWSAPDPPPYADKDPGDYTRSVASWLGGIDPVLTRGRFLQVTEPGYETAAEQQQRIGHTDSVVCADCGVFVMNKAAHTRFHSILSGHAWALAVLKTAHVAVHVHDRYDVAERIDSKRFDSLVGGCAGGGHRRTWRRSAGGRIIRGGFFLIPCPAAGAVLAQCLIEDGAADAAAAAPAAGLGVQPCHEVG